MSKWKFDLILGTALGITGLGCLLIAALTLDQDWGILCLFTIIGALVLLEGASVRKEIEEKQLVER